jgi:hypothetical protein
MFVDAMESGVVMSMLRAYHIIVPSLMLLAAGSPVQAKGYSPPGPLPGIESTLQTCRDQVLRLGHGTIESARTIDRNGQRFHVFFMRDRGGIDWLVACGSADGQIVQVVGLDRL